jgi:hypothetical protein
LDATKSEGSRQRQAKRREAEIRDDARDEPIEKVKENQEREGKEYRGWVRFGKERMNGREDRKGERTEEGGLLHPPPL